jgi:ribosomal protein L22
VKDALVFLDFLPKKAGRILAKVIASANANAKIGEGSDVTAIVSTVDVGK